MKARAASERSNFSSLNAKFPMNRCLAFIAAASSLVAACALKADARQMNIILIMADDLGYETIGANDGESYHTPELDRLAATGMRFTHCFVQPLCTPTRVELMTGLSNVRNYVRFGEIDPRVTTFAHLLKEAGYASGIAGKWQLGRVKDLPQKLGFDESCLWQHMRRPSRYANPGLEYNGEERDFRDGEYGPDLVNAWALDFITRHKAKPFLLYYPMMLTHGPFQPTPDSADWDPTFNGNEKRKKDPKYFADMVAYMDKLVGRVAKKVDELGLRKETLIIFLGDNGTGREITSQFQGQPYPGGKGLTNARGMHVPLIVNWPGQTPAGSVSDDLVSSVDFLPTLCEAAGVKPPQGLMDGESFLGKARGAKSGPREPLYFWYSKDGGQRRKTEFAMTQFHKLYGNGRFVDLTKDPFEEGQPLREGELTGEDHEAAKELRSVLNQYADARPADLMNRPERVGGRRLRRLRNR